MIQKYYWAVTLLFPFILFLFIEMTLRAGGYQAESQDLFIEVPIQDEYLVVNPAFLSRYFPSFTPKVAKTPFLKKKDPNTFRIFVLGGSSAQGFPYNHYNSFSTQLEQRLLMETLGLEVEVINLGMTAVNSFVIWDLSKRLIEYEPDAILIYAGHNEYYGSFGVGSTQFGFGQGVGLKRLIINLKNWRLYQLMENMLRPETDHNPNYRTMMARVVKESGITLASDIYQAGINQFEKNISEALSIFRKESIPVFIGTITSNLKDQPPMGEDETALDYYDKGRHHFANGSIDSAHSAFLNAKEYDPIRFRAPEEINEVIAKIAREQDAFLVKINKEAAEASQSGIQDNSFFTDHLHPDWQGHQLLADLYFEELKERLKVIRESYAPNPLYKRSMISRFERVFAEVQVKRLTVGYPFQKGLSGEQEYAQFQHEYDKYLQNSYVDSIAATTWRMQREEYLSLIDVINEANKQKDTLSVLLDYQQLAYWQLFNADLLKKGASYALKNRKYDVYSAKMLHIILRMERSDPFFANSLAALYLLHEDLERSEFWLEEARRLDDKNLLLWYSYARLYALQGDSANARSAFQKYLDLRNNP